MYKFTEHKGVVVPLDITNIDTDTIIPKQFLQKVNKIGFGKYLFHDWRFMDQKQEILNTNFILNLPIYQNASILLTRENFGCGSSREHAVWSLIDYGFKVIIAPSFADIFYNNSFNNKLLLITLPQNNINNIFNIVNDMIGIQCFVSLLHKKIVINNTTYLFEIDDFRRVCLLYDLDDIDLTMKHIKKIVLYENNILNFLLSKKEFIS